MRGGTERQHLKKTHATEEFWAAFVAASDCRAADYVVVAFGNTAAMADELIALVLEGRKRATAGLARDFPPGGEPLPKAGDYVVTVDGEGEPRCIWRSTEVVVRPFKACDAAFAWDEGEGDRTLDWWFDAHRAYFVGQAKRQGFEMHDEIETVFERFTVVWPPEVADPAE